MTIHGGWGDIHVISRHSNLLVRVQDIHTQSLTTTFFIIEKKNKQLCQEMGCQRHNSEAVILSLEERIKEKDKQHRLVSWKRLIVIVHHGQSTVCVDHNEPNTMVH